MEITQIFEKINFADRYRTMCDMHTDFDNRMRGFHTALYQSVLSDFGYKYKYSEVSS